MKELLVQNARYNVWANKLITDVLLKLTDEQLDQEIVSSFPSIRQTAYHSWGAEDIWLQRLALAERPVWTPHSFTGTFAEACAAWQKASAELLQFTEKQYDDKALQHEVLYYDLKKMPQKTPVYQILQHVFNHATYHRGQLVTMMRQVGVTEIPQTDFIAFVRKK